MTQKENTNLRDISFSAWHRQLNKGLYMTDIDHYLFYSIKNNEEELAALADLKKGDVIDINGKFNTKSVLSLKYSAIKAQIKMADKLEVPFFFIITYLEKVAIPMFYVIPINDRAKITFKKYSPDPGVWLSEQHYLNFECFLRKIPVTNNELSNNFVTYHLPQFDF